jgi:hypothetical protein
VPWSLDGESPGDGDGGGVQELRHAGPHEPHPEQETVVEVDDHSRVSGVSVGIEVRSWDRGAHVHVHDLHAVAVALGLRGGEPDRPHFGVGEECLGHGEAVCRCGVSPPRSGVQWSLLGACADCGAGDAGLVLALMSQHCLVVDIAEGVEPFAVDTACQAGAIDVDPRSWEQTDGVQAGHRSCWLGSEYGL